MTDLGQSIPSSWFLAVSATAFAIGLLGLIVRRHPIGMLMCLEIMLNAAALNFVVFWRDLGSRAEATSGAWSGPIGAIVLITLSAAEVAVGIALILLCTRLRRDSDTDHYNDLSG